ncbi:hypothetical protein B4071_2119 [Bacillus subtilis]|nr:hypothetical protein B4071_2119 [Bacillus subtilis]
MLDDVFFCLVMSLATCIDFSVRLFHQHFLNPENRKPFDLR